MSTGRGDEALGAADCRRGARGARGGGRGRARAALRVPQPQRGTSRADRDERAEARGGGSGHGRDCATGLVAVRPGGRCRFLNRLRGSTVNQRASYGTDWTNPQGSILPPSDRGRRLGRRLRSFHVRPTPGRRGTGSNVGGAGALVELTNRPGLWKSPGTAGPASGFAARTRSSWRIPISRSSDRPAAGSPATSSPSATPTTGPCPRPRARAAATARRSCRRASTTRSSSTAPASTRSRKSSSPACGPTATTPAAPSAARACRSSSRSTASTPSTSARSATC